MFWKSEDIYGLNDLDSIDAIQGLLEREVSPLLDIMFLSIAEYFERFTKYQSAKCFAEVTTLNSDLVGD